MLKDFASSASAVASASEGRCTTYRLLLDILWLCDGRRLTDEFRHKVTFCGIWINEAARKGPVQLSPTVRPLLPFWQPKTEILEKITIGHNPLKMSSEKVFSTKKVLN